MAAGGPFWSGSISCPGCSLCCCVMASGDGVCIVVLLICVVCGGWVVGLLFCDDCGVWVALYAWIVCGVWIALYARIAGMQFD